MGNMCQNYLEDKTVELDIGEMNDNLESWEKGEKIEAGWDLIKGSDDDLSKEAENEPIFKEW